MQTYDQILGQPYDNNASVEAFRALLASPRDTDCIERVILTSLPVLKKVLVTQFAWITPGSEIYEEAVSESVLLLTRVAMEDRLYSKKRGFEDNPDSHFSYLFTIFRFEVIAVLRRLNHNIPEREPGRNGEVVSSPVMEPIYPVVQSDLNDSHLATYVRVFISQIPDMLRERASKMIRFAGKDKQIVLAVIDSLLRAEAIPTYVIRNVLQGAKNLPFFEEYAEVLLRMALEEIREDVQHLPAVHEEITQMAYVPVPEFGSHLEVVL